jgi:hypothetical protein
MNIFNIVCNASFASKMDKLSDLMDDTTFFMEPQSPKERAARRAEEKRRIRANLQDPRIQRRIELQQKFGGLTTMAVSWGLS